MVSFPGSIPSLPRPTSSTLMDATGFEGDVVVDLISDEVEAIATELGTDPAGPFATVKARLDGSAGLYWLPMVAGKYHAAGQALVVASGIADYEQAQLFIPARSCTIDRLAVVVTSGGGTGSVTRLGIRAWDASTALPGTLLVDGGTVASTTTGAKEVTVSYAVTAGTPYVLVSAPQGGTTPAYVGYNGVALPFGSSPPNSNASPCLIASAAGAFPSTQTWYESSSSTPRVWVRTSA